METALKTRRALFWDINENDIERVLTDSDEWVVDRVFEYGTLDDIRELIRLYGVDHVKSILSRLTLKPMTRSMAFLFFGIDKDKRYVA